MRATVLLIGLLLVGCGNSSTSDSAMSEASTTPPGPSSAPSSPPATATATESTTDATPAPSSSRSGQRKGTIIITADSQFGAMLYDASGQAIYLFDAERGSRPECYGECAEDWPPVLTSGTPQARRSVQSDLVGITRRSDGATQVTYGGHPLYFYAHEGKYQVLCHNIEEYGGTWLVVQPDGQPAPH